jgi:hypothetical protein
MRQTLVKWSVVIRPFCLLLQYAKAGRVHYHKIIFVRVAKSIMSDIPSQAIFFLAFIHLHSLLVCFAKVLLGKTFVRPGMARPCTRLCVHQFISRWCWSSRCLIFLLYRRPAPFGGFLSLDGETQIIDLAEYFFMRGQHIGVGLGYKSVLSLESSASWYPAYVISFVEHTRI